MEEIKMLTCDWCNEKDTPDKFVKVEDGGSGAYLDMHEECKEDCLDKYMFGE